MTPGVARAYAWYEILSLTFKFCFSEFYMFNREQLELLAKWHRLAMFVAIALLTGVLVGTLVEAQNDTRARVSQELDRHDERIRKLDEEVKEVRLGQAILAEKMQLVLFLLGTIATILLGQLTISVWKMKAGTAINHIIDQEFDRRKIKTRRHDEES